jgi:hypothetical protein
MKIALLLLAALVSASAQTALKVAVEIGGKDEVKLGMLTITEQTLDFEGAELMFSLPLGAVEDVQVAGFREKWMSVGVRGGSDFAKSYSFLLQADRSGARNAPGRVQFLLPPSADLKSALTIARDFKARVDAAIATRQAQEQALQAAKAQEEKEKLERQQAEKAAKQAPVSPAVPSEERRQTVAAHKPKILFVVQAYYLSKKPSGFVKSYGLSGELVFREDGIGFTFSQANQLDAERQRAAEGGSLWVPAATATGTIHTQKAILGATPTMFWVGLTPKQGDPAFERLRPLLTDAGELLFTVRQTSAASRIADLLTEYNTANFGGNAQ